MGYDRVVLPQIREATRDSFDIPQVEDALRVPATDISSAVNKAMRHLILNAVESVTVRHSRISGEGSEPAYTVEFRLHDWIKKFCKPEFPKG